MSYFKINPKSTIVTVKNEKAFDQEYPQLPHIEPPSPPVSSRSNALSGPRQVDDIKHQVMLNRLYQQQRSQLWIQDLSGQAEGVMLRKERNKYIFSPPSLAKSEFAHAMKLLNIQVSHCNSTKKRR
jgi:hypothetical protein